MNHTSNAAASLLVVALALPSHAVLAQAPSRAPSADTKGSGPMQDMGAMNDRMKKMQAQMEKLRQTTDPKEREKLLGEHMQAMQDSMQGMRGMGGQTMMAKPGAGPGTTPERRMQMMEQRMEMMQMMMQQMMDHQKSMGAPAR